MELTIEEIFRATSTILTFDVYRHQDPSTGTIRYSNIFGGEWTNAFEMVIWISTKSEEELYLSFRKKDMKNIIVEVAKRDEWSHILHLFLMRGLDPNSLAGRYPLLFISSKENMKLLLEYGADPNARMKGGLDALHYLLKKIKEDTLEKAKMLVWSGADVYYRYQNISSHEKIVEQFGESILPHLREWMDRYTFRENIIYPLPHSNEAAVIKQILRKEEEEQIKRNDTVSNIIQYAAAHNVPLSTYGLDRKNILEQYKYEIFTYLTHAENLQRFCEMFIRKKKYAMIHLL
jgi:hypothetical protein